VEIYKEAVARCLTAPLGKSIDEVVAMLRLPPEPEMGDYAFPCFTLAKERKQAPPQIASALAAEVAVQAPIASVQAHGPYLNFKIDDDVLSRQVIQQILDRSERYGHGDEGRGRKVMATPHPAHSR
jgi:arginyl-tRNA synthetase